MHQKMVAAYQIFDISHVEPIDFEQMGTKYKFWYKNESEDLYLFKATLSTDYLGSEVQRLGEDWAEKIACEIAKELNIPCAEYELALYNGQQGVITKNFVSDDENMEYGNTLLANLLTTLELPPLESNYSHRIPEIVTCLNYSIINKPKGWPSLPKIKSAADVFSGYLMLDVLISNQDRHNENWGMVASKNKHPYLAPTFDHAASLGRNESDEKRELRLKSNDKGQSVSTYVSRAKSQILTQDFKRRSTLDAFITFSKLAAPDAAVSWLKRLEDIDNQVLLNIIRRVPEAVMSETSKDFSFSIVSENKDRLLKSISLIENYQKSESHDE